jgi:hypothetical protein
LLAQQPIERKQRKFNALVIPKAVEASLPFKSKRKDTPSRRRPLLEDRRAVVMEPHERKTHAMLQSLRVIKTEKVFRLILALILCLNPPVNIIIHGQICWKSNWVDKCKRFSQTLDYFLYLMESVFGVKSTWYGYYLDMFVFT